MALHKLVCGKSPSCPRRPHMLPPLPLRGYFLVVLASFRREEQIQDIWIVLEKKMRMDQDVSLSDELPGQASPISIPDVDAVESELGQEEITVPYHATQVLPIFL